MNKKIIIGIVAVVLVFLGIFTFALPNEEEVTDVTAPVVTLNGDAVQYLELGETYTELGSTVVDDVDTLTAVVTGTVNTRIAGKYELTYTATDSSGKTDTETRTVYVRPTITAPANYVHTVGNAYAAPRGTVLTNLDEAAVELASDNEASVLLNTPGVYTLRFNYVTEDGARALEKTFTVTVVDRTAPVVTLNGEAEVFITIGEEYEELGSTVVDNVNTLTAVITGTVNNRVSGTYELTYTATDGSGNSSFVTRTVYVRPLITAPADYTHSVGDVYTAPKGTVVVDLDGGTIVLTSDNESDVLVNTLGEYILRFNYTYLGIEALEKTSKVTVVDTTAPVVTLNGEDVQYLELGETYTELGSTVVDDVDTLTAVVTGTVNIRVSGTYELTYTATDGSGNSSFVTRTVYVRPLITAPADYTHNVGDAYTAPKGTVVVDLDGGTIVLTSDNESDVLVNTLGEYTLRFNYTYLGIEALEKTSKVTVVDTTAPVVTFSPEGNDTAAQSYSTVVAVTDNVAVNESSFKYLWNKAPDTTPSVSAFVTSFTNGSTINTPNGKSGGYYLWVYVEDMEGNYNITRSERFRLDNNNPDLVSIVYTPNTLTNGNVLVTLTVNEKINPISGWTKVTNKIYQKEYSLNIDEDVAFSDLSGNINTANVLIDWIDKVSPTGTFGYSTTTPTNGTVVATLTPSENVTVTNNGGSFTYEFTTNGSFTFELVDDAGNVGTAVATVANIDQEAPVLNVKTTSIGNASSKLFSSISLNFTDNLELGYINLNGTVTNLSGTSFDVDNVSSGYGLVEGANSITLYDEAGNSVTYEFTVDVTKPVVAVNLNRLTWITSGSVVSKLQVPEYRATDLHLDSVKIYNSMNSVVSQVLGLTVTTRYAKFTHLGDGVYTIVAYDKAGNASDVFTVTMDNVNPVLVLDNHDLGYISTSSFDVTGTVNDLNLQEYKYQLLDASKNEVGSSIQGGTTNVIGTLFTVDASSLTDGVYWVRVWAIDKAGNQTGDLTDTYLIRFIIDKNAPTIVVKDTSVGSSTYKVYSNISFEISDVMGLSYAELNGTNTVLSGTSTSLDNVIPGSFGAVEGANTLVVYDIYGNSVTYNFTLDITNPEVVVREGSTIITTGTYVDLVNNIGIQIKDNNIGKIYINGIEYPQYFGAGYYGINWIINRYNTLETFVLVAYDKAGNVSSNFTIKVDRTKPVLTIKDSSIGSTFYKVYKEVSFKLSDNRSIDYLTLNGVLKDVTDSQWGDLNNVKPGLYGAVEGTNTLILYDIYGNSTTYEFTLDTGFLYYSNFNSVNVSSTNVDGAWYVDRYAPNGFSSSNFGGNNVLLHSINATDSALTRPSSYSSAFYNTQGRKFNTDGATEFTIQLYIPSSWASTTARLAGIWGVGFDETNSISSYPILEFATIDGYAQFRIYDFMLGQYINIGLPSGFAYDQWYTLNIKLDTSTNTFVFSVNDLSYTFTANDTKSMDEIILQGYNTTTGTTYNIYWDNLMIKE